MIRCLILGCASVKDPAETSRGVTFFEFPHDPDIRRKWCENIEDFQGPLTEFTQVCERHFEPEAFIADQPYLKRDAVPMFFETEYKTFGNKTLLQIINGCVEEDDSGQVRCKLKDNGVCDFSQETFESRALLRHICEAHSAFAGYVGLPGVKKSTNVATASKDGISAKVLKHVSLEPDGYHCRIEDSTCLYFNPTMYPANFARHFRDMHPVQAFDNGFFDGFSREKISLKKRVKFKNRIEKLKPMIRSKVVHDGTRYRCNIDVRSRCNFSVKVFNTNKIREHFCVEHPAEANQCMLFQSNQQKLRTGGLNFSQQETLSSKIVQMVEANVIRTRKNIVRCRISNSNCKYKQRKYVPANFYCHFCINHPEEARAKGFFASEAENSEEPCEREPAPTPMEAAEEPHLPKQNSPLTVPDYTPEIKEEPTEETQDDDLRLTTEREPAPTPMETAEELHLPKQNSPLTVPDYTPEIKEEPTEETQDDDLRLTTPSNDPSTYCRLCFSIAQPLRPIFTGPADNDGSGGLVELISNCTNIRLCARMDFPSAICYECQQKLNEIHRFRELCETFDTVVRRQGRINRDVSAESEEEPEATSVSDAPSQVETAANSNDDGDGQQLEPEMIHYTEHEIRGQKYFKCIDCGFLAKKGYYVTRHWKRFHMSRNTKIYCTMTGCSEFFFSTQCRQVHLKIVHRIEPQFDPGSSVDGISFAEMYVKLEDGQYACRICGKLNPSGPAAVTHFRQIHRQTKRKQPKGPKSSVDDVCQVVNVNGKSYLKCRDCDVMMVKKSDMAVHWLQQHGNQER
uniref:ZAD domain-containing protein n=1 Tax=Culex tarsalis TaxID=7177 RepID=A0A1Q3F1X2_CULTA